MSEKRSRVAHSPAPNVAAAPTAPDAVRVAQHTDTGRWKRVRIAEGPMWAVYRWERAG